MHANVFQWSPPLIPSSPVPSPASQFLSISSVLLFNSLLPAIASGTCMKGGSSFGSLVSRWPHHWGKLALTHPAAISCHSSLANGGDFGTTSPLHARIVSAWFCLRIVDDVTTAVGVYVPLPYCIWKRLFCCSYLLSLTFTIFLPLILQPPFKLQLSFYIFPSPPEKFVKL